MDLKTAVDGDEARIIVEGKLTVQSAPEFEEAISGFDESVSNFDIDLTLVDYIASAGLRVLVAANKTAVARGGTMVLRGANDDVYSVFEMTGLSEVFTIERA